MKEEFKKVNMEKLDQVAGGAAGTDYVHDLNNFVYKTVVVPPGTFLVMQTTPNGAFMKEQYSNSDSIFVHRNFWENGYLLAWKNGIYGFVDAKYVR